MMLSDSKLDSLIGKRVVDKIFTKNGEVSSYYLTWHRADYYIADIDGAYEMNDICFKDKRLIVVTDKERKILYAHYTH